MDSIGCVDIGNQYLKYARFSLSGEILESWSEPNNNAKETLRLLSQKCRLIISDVSGITGTFALNSNSTRLTIEHKFPFEIAYKTPKTLGIDRLCGLSGAIHLEPNTNCLVFSLGTCLTIDFIGTDRVYRGGNISPGLTLRYKALHQFTEKLPLIAYKNSETLFGNDTETAIQSGVQNGLLSEIEYYISMVCEEFDNTSVFLTGGDRVYFENRLKSKIFAAPYLNLQGLYNIAKINGII